MEQTCFGHKRQKRRGKREEAKEKRQERRGKRPEIQKRERERETG